MADERKPGPTFDTYDERVAEGLVRAHDKADGLPGYLGIRLTDTWPGGMRAEIQVRDELLTPIGNLHGGVLAGLCDHVLGTVCYPVMPRGTLAAVAQIVSLTKRTAVVRIEVDNDGRQVCLAQGTVLVMRPKA